MSLPHAVMVDVKLKELRRIAVGVAVAPRRELSQARNRYWPRAPTWLCVRYKARPTDPYLHETGDRWPLQAG